MKRVEVHKNIEREAKIFGLKPSGFVFICIAAVCCVFWLIAGVTIIKMIASIFIILIAVAIASTFNNPWFHQLFDEELPDEIINDL